MDNNVNNIKPNINVNLDSCSYEIYIKNGIVNKISSLLSKKTENNKVLIVADIFFKDSIVKKIISDLNNNYYIVHVYFMNAGKGNKNFNELLKIYAILEENNLARDSTILAVGGGVIGDLAGFIASTWYRGMNLVHIPTTLMAMVDSSVGGKVAVNYRHTINAIGNYHHPIFILMDLDLIYTLPDRDYISGIAEVIKCAIISDKDLYGYLEMNANSILNREEKDVIYFLSKAIKIKISHVLGDVRERGKRLLLNYGHTLGHAIEISTEKNNQEQYRHGEGVSIGIIAVAHIATKYLKISGDIEKSYLKIMKLYGLPTFVNTKMLEINRDFLFKQCIQNVKKDKKRIGGYLRLILSENIGEASVYKEVPFKYIEEAFKYIIK
jgi:3-dehydroquinate synthase